MNSPAGLTAQTVPEKVPFWGTRIVVATTLINMLSGALVGAYGVYVVPIEAEFSATRTQLSLGMSLLVAMQALVSPVTGRIVDKGPLRLVMATGVLMAALGMWLITRVDTLWQIGLCFVTLVAIGKALFGQIPNTTLISNWYIRRRGLMLGIGGSGITAASAVMPPITAWLMMQGDWRFALLVTALIALAVALPLILLVVVKRPEEVGQYPDGEPPAVTEGAIVRPRDMTMADLFRNHNFWVIVVMFGTGLGMLVALFINLYPYALAVLGDEYRASYILFFAGTAMLVGQIFWGRMGDLYDKRWVWCGAFLTQIAGILLLLVEPGFGSMVVAGLLIGAGLGAVLPLIAALVAEVFGRVNFGQVYGDLHFVTLPLVLGIPPLMGYVYDISSSYRLTFFCFALILALVGFTALCLCPPVNGELGYEHDRYREMG